MKKALTTLARIVGFILLYFVGTGLSIGLWIYPPIGGVMLLRELIPHPVATNLMFELVVLLPVLGGLFMLWVGFLQWGLSQFRTPPFIERGLFWLFNLDPEEGAAP